MMMVMEDQEEPLSLASTFPNPPPFWRDFTPDNMARIEEFRRGHDGPMVGRVHGLPEDLVRLQPPPEPVDGRWRVFGDQYMLDDKLPTLEDQGIDNLPTAPPPSSRDAKHYDRAFELKRLAKSLLLSFLELAGVLSRSPADAEPKINDLRTLLINVHHIINEYRPHQARESAIEMMQDHLDRTRGETVAIRTQVDKARRVLEGLGSLGLMTTMTAGQGMVVNGGTEAGDLVVAERGGKTDEEERDKVAMERDAHVWTAADALFT